MATVGALRLALEALGQVFQLVQDFREGNDTIAFIAEDEGIPEYESMLIQPEFMDGSVVVPGIPVVGVFLRRDSAP